MVKILISLLMLSFLSGCAGVNECAKNKLSPLKIYAPSTGMSKNGLANDLRSGKIAIGEKLDYIRSNYGDPDNMFIAGCIVRINYKLDTGKIITLWFEDGDALSMWKD